MKIASITPCLWFDHEAADVAAFYVKVFEQAHITSSNPIVTMMEIAGSPIMLLNGGPKFQLDESFSFMIECDSQKEIDYFWDTLTEGGEESMCGWLKDKFGVSWQVVPSVLSELMSDADRAPRVMNAFLKMRKFNIQQLLDA